MAAYDLVKGHVRMFRGDMPLTAALAATARIKIAVDIQKRHQELVQAMRRHGLLNKVAGRRYPKNLTNTNTVAKTHPLFYVKKNGDLVFRKLTRLEYARMVFQETFLGKWGLNPWRWRAAIDKITAKQKDKAWALGWLGRLRLAGLTKNAGPRVRMTRTRPKERPKPKGRKSRAR